LLALREHSGRRSKKRRALRIKQQYINFLVGTNGQDAIEEQETEEEESEQAFAAESDLRDFLAKNPASIEPGLSLSERRSGGG
jgi:RecB family endonuclease NucS